MSRTAGVFSSLAGLVLEPSPQVSRLGVRCEDQERGEISGSESSWLGSEEVGVEPGVVQVWGTHTGVTRGVGRLALSH